MLQEFPQEKAAVKWPDASTLVAMWNATRHYSVTEGFVKEIKNRINLRDLTPSCADHCVCFGIPVAKRCGVKLLGSMAK